MARVRCRCGEALEVRSTDPDRVSCPRCGAKVRVRRDGTPPMTPPTDGFIRFHCPCGRRLKVRESDKAEAGKCPDCGRVVPVPDPAVPGANAAAPARVEKVELGARTEDLDAADLERLERWSQRLAAAAAPPAPRQGLPTTASHQAMQAVAAVNEQAAQASPPVKMEAGLRLCARCGKPLHISATVCRSCGEPVPKR